MQASSSAVAQESPICGLWPNGMTSSNDDSMARIGSQYVKYAMIIILGADCQADVCKGLSYSLEACVAAAILCGHSPPTRLTVLTANPGREKKACRGMHLGCLRSKRNAKLISRAGH